MCLKPRSIPWNMTVNMAEALPQWSSDARHPSEVCDGCTNQTRRATPSPGIPSYYAALTGCMLARCVAPHNNSTRRPGKTKLGGIADKQRGGDARKGKKEKRIKRWTCDKLQHPLKWLFDPVALDIGMDPVLMFSMCFIPGKSLVYVSWLHPRGN